MVDLTQCYLDDDVIDQTEGSTGEVDTSSWTSWSVWTKCSEPCGGGLSNRTRYCATLTDSELEVEENICSGHSHEVRVCNRQSCISGSRRQSYCRPLMNRFFHGKRYYWEAFTDPRRPCKAMCHARIGNFYVPTGDTVTDGTPCDETGNDICIAGRCNRVGCDSIVGSTAKMDLCGVCNGKERSCRVVRSNFTVDANLMKYGYNRIMTIPKGAFNINITELESSRNYLAMKTKSGYSILNSHWRLSHYGNKYVLGTVMDYQRRTNVSCPAQCVFIVGPINDDIHVQLLFYRASSHFSYQFSTPLDMNGDHNHVYDITGEPSGKAHHHRSSHPSSSNQHSQRHRQRHRQHGKAHERQHSQSRSRSGQSKHDSKKRRFQYNESFMAPRHSSHRKRDSEPTDPSPRRTQTLRNTRKNRVSPTNQSLQRNTSSPTNRNGRRHRGGRPLSGNASPFRPTATSLYNRPHRIPNRRISTQWSHSSLEENQPARQGSRDVIGAPSPTIVIANTRLSGDRIRERQQPVRVENGHRQQQPDQSTSQLSLGTNTVRSTGQGRYLHTGGVQLPDTLPNSKSGSNIVGESRGYSWRISGFTECSRSCGGGTEETIVVCVKDNSQVVVTDENCDQNRKPEAKSVTCNQTPCQAEWFAGPWTECSATCGTGTQTRQVTCQQRVSSALNLTVSAEACRGQVRNQTNRTCSLQPCFFWKVANWSECSSTCGKGMRARSVTCMNIDGHSVHESKCEEMKPAREEFCDMGSCATGWFFTDWPEKCPSVCGEGTMKRSLHCAADDNTTLPDERCKKFPTPRLEKKCKADAPCGGKWFLGPWSKCNTTCGEGWKNRDVVCIKQLSGAVLMVVEDNNCAMEEKPDSAVACEQEPCPPQWYMMNWSKCSKSCDLGHRTREVKCINSNGRPSLACDVRQKPAIRESCNLQSCGMTTVAPVSGCSDLLGQCNLVVRARLCNYHYYHRICCASCAAANEHPGHVRVVNDGISLTTTKATTPTTVSSSSPTWTTYFSSTTEMAMTSDNSQNATTNSEESSITTPNADSTDSES